jgi:hypothetical protein
MQLVLFTADDGDKLTVLAGTAGEPAPLPAGLPVKSTARETRAAVAQVMQGRDV